MVVWSVRLPAGSDLSTRWRRCCKFNSLQVGRRFVTEGCGKCGPGCGERSEATLQIQLIRKTDLCFVQGVVDENGSD